MSLKDAQEYWKKNVRIISIVLAIWAFVSLGMSVLFMPFLKDVSIFGNISLPFWFAHQGAMFTFVILIFAYARIMDGLDKAYGLDE